MVKEPNPIFILNGIAKYAGAKCSIVLNLPIKKTEMGIAKHAGYWIVFIKLSKTNTQQLYYHWYIGQFILCHC